MDRLQGHNMIRPSYQSVDGSYQSTESYEMPKSPYKFQESQVNLSYQDPPPQAGVPLQGPNPYWHTGFFRRFPWLGIGALFVALVATLVPVIILVRSNGQAVDSWKVQPSVILSIASAVFKAAL
jgi:hypothetical protein